jgi:CheY-like chemotaxis protein
MSDFAIIEESLTGEDLYEVVCWQCASQFDAMAAQWCDCQVKLHTLKCSSCASCFCQAPFLYKHKFWAGAPKSLRESSRRFGLSAPDPASPAPAVHPSPGVAVIWQPHILIVDDEEPIRSLVACYVEQIGYRVTTVSGPEEALTLLATDSFDAVLTDALMPKMDGRELCREIKQRHGNEMKVIVMTSLYKARHFQTEARHVFKVDEYLAKPLRYDDLRDALQRVAPLKLLPHAQQEALAG